MRLPRIAILPLPASEPEGKMNILRLCLPPLTYITGYIVLLIGHWRDPLAWLGYALILTAAIIHFLPERRRRR
jgi:hypothetical protein